MDTLHKRSRSSAGSEEWMKDFAAQASDISSSVRSTSTDGECSHEDSQAPPSTETYESSETFSFDWQAGGAKDKTWNGKSRIWAEDKPGGPARSLQSAKQLAVYAPTSSAEDSPAKTSPSPESEQAFMAN